jgi:hypothetical protein
MLYSEIIAVCSAIHIEHTNKICGQNVKFLSVKTGGTYSDHRTLMGSCCEILFSYRVDVEDC